MRPVTVAIHENERAWSLRELNLVRPPTRQWHRWQIVTVIRDDKLTEWWNDLGPVENFTAPQVEIPGLLEHSVAELRAIADDQRNQDDYWAKRSQEIAAESTIITDAINQHEERSRVINNRSSFGPSLSKQRNGFDRKAAIGK